MNTQPVPNYNPEDERYQSLKKLAYNSTDADGNPIKNRNNSKAQFQSKVKRKKKNRKKNKAARKARKRK